MGEVFVVAESRRPLDWFFDPDKVSYVRRDKAGNATAVIPGALLPDPEQIKAMLAKAIGQGYFTNGRVDADPVTRKLWEHYHANLNA